MQLTIMIPLLVIFYTKHSLKQFLEEKKTHEISIITNLTPQASEYSIDQIREIKKEVKVGNPMKRTYILEDFDKSSFEAQNSFLKLLEEPPDNVEFILCVSQPYLLLPTIISRTKIIRLGISKVSKGDKNFKKKDFHSVDFSLFTCSSRDDCLDILTQVLLFFRERFLDDPKSTAIIKESLTVYRLVQNNNINPQLALDHLLIFIQKRYNGYNRYNNYNP